ncbi:MAG TPA: penicillin acylase family protein [Phototrophicaceae bacterium]|nr:penicillin acylase family protein [Phototrophicaceae bacterium]
MRILRIILLILLLLIVVIVVGGFLIYNDTLNGPLPQTSGSLNVNGLDAQVEVLRDNWGIPHIYGSNMHDVFFAQGYVQAQDRWWQMEFFRHTGDGSIEELTGKQASVLGTDVFIRTVGWERTAEKTAAQMAAPEKAVLQAFTDGVNAYILNRPASDLALEYRLLGLTGVSIPIQPWTITDTLVWGEVMSWNLTDATSYKYTRQELTADLGTQMTTDFAPAWPYNNPDRPTILYPEDLPISAASMGAAATSEITAQNVVVSPLLAGNVRIGQFAYSGNTDIGSNNWVATGSMTQTGKPLLANDPHLGIQMPSIWYEIGLHCLPQTAACPLNVVGFAFAPAPGVIIGHNDKISWGVTNAEADVQDLYEIKVNPNNPLQYQWNGQWKAMSVVNETIAFGDNQPPLTIKVRETDLGPVINDNQIDDKTGQISGYNTDDPMVLRWTGNDPSTVFDAVLKLDQASDWNSFRAALSEWDIPSQNFVYADIMGNIGYQMPGRIPIRPKGQASLMPYPVSSDADVWQGFIPYDDLPRIYNPARNFIVTANQATVPMQYYDQLAQTLGKDQNYLFSYDWDYGERAQRVTELLKQDAPNTIATYQTIQGDNKNVDAELIMPYLADLQISSGSVRQARDYLTTWDFQMSKDSGQAALFGEFQARLLQDVFGDQLPSDIQVDNHEVWSVVQLLAQPNNPWWDDATTKDQVEARDDILLKALSEAVQATTAALGNNPADWQWGKLHTATFVSNPLGMSGIDLIEKLVNRGPVAVSGSTDTVNATGWDPSSGNFDTQSLPSMRMIVDVSNFDNSVTMDTTGQSGNPGSPHYDDMIDNWRTIQYHPMLWSRTKVEAATVDRLVLNPAG